MKLNKKKWLMIGLISLGVVLIIVVVIYFIKKGKKASKIVSDAKKQSDKQQNIDSSNICNYNIKPNEKDSEYWVAEWPN